MGRTNLNRRRTSDIHLSIPNQMLDKIDEEVEMGQYRNRTHAVLYYIRVGMRIDEFKVKCEDPAFAKEVRASWGVEEVAEWLANMPEEQKQTIAKAWELAQRKRLEKEKLFGIINR